MDDLEIYKFDICKISTDDKECFQSHLLTKKQLRNMHPT